MYSPTGIDRNMIQIGDETPNDEVGVEPQTKVLDLKQGWKLVPSNLYKGNKLGRVNKNVASVMDPE